ncbi:hypothetical protein ROLI_034320 [Roseobacter fucihabitans]|uniref:Uncharacterized protein n=1 Tax=Roseobacter fucihabitans TaxID=1537242 RepID=A0ABZ2BYQ9_9RHOB|nr:hypothetical protein [Roseobacter litoralis]
MLAIPIGWPFVVSPEPFGFLLLCLADGFKGRVPHPFAVSQTVAALDIDVLPRFAGLFVCEGYIVLFSPHPRFSADLAKSSDQLRAGQ